MGLITGLHGVVGAVLLCALLFVDEAGVPLPLVPSEVLLLVAGLLMASGALPIWVFLPVAALMMGAGMLAGYAWSRAVGQTGLYAVAERVGAVGPYDRARARLSAASPAGICMARLLPGVRPYATLVSGAAPVKLRVFLSGALPALVAWLLVWSALGMLVGLPIVHALRGFEKLLFRGGILIVLGLVAYVALRHAHKYVPPAVCWTPKSGRAFLAATIDGGIVACVVAGVLAIGRLFMHTGHHPALDVAIVAVLVAAYLIAMRDRPGAMAAAALLC